LYNSENLIVLVILGILLTETNVLIYNNLELEF